MYGLILAGGGAKGAYQIGAWKAMRELELEIGLVCGTSVGALNGAFIAQDQFELAVEMWNNMDMDGVFEADSEILDNIDEIAKGGILKTNVSLLKNVYEHLTKNKGLNINPLRKKMNDLLDEELIRNNNIDFGLVTINLNDYKPLRLFVDEIPMGELKYYLLGSALVPGFSQDKNHPLKFMDGGVYDNFPIKMAVEKGYKNIIAIQLHNKSKPKYKGVEITYIKPSEYLGNFLYFEKDKSKRNMELGYLDTMKTFDKLQGHEYFFNTIPQEHEIVVDLISISDEDRVRLCNYCGITINTSDRYLLEKVIPKISSKIQVKTRKTYQDFMFGLLEYLLKKAEMNRIKEYNFLEIKDVISSKLYTRDSTEDILQIFTKKIR